jgi:hypothetical protein
MRKKRPLDSLFPRTRQAILTATLLHPEHWWYLSDLAKYLGVRPSSLQRELDGLRAVVARDLTDARVVGLSTDRQFATAYNAVLQLAKMAIACAGYRVVNTTR